MQEALSELKREFSRSSEKSPMAKTSDTETKEGEKAEESEKPPQAQSRSRIVLNRVNSAGEREDVEYDKKPTKQSSSAQVKGYEFTLRKFIEEDPRQNHSEIEIESPPLRNFMKELLISCPYHTFRGSPQTLYSPYEAIVLNWDQLAKAAEDRKFSPWPVDRKDWFLRCWAYDWDGSQFQRLPLKLRFARFEESKPINSLPFYPLECHEDSDTLRRKLIERGKKYRRFCTASLGSQMFSYDGQAVLVKRGLSSMRDFMKRDTDTHDDSSIFSYSTSTSSTSAGFAFLKDRVMVDFKSYFEKSRCDALIGDITPEGRYGECQCPTCQTNQELMALYRTRFDRANIDGRDWDAEQYLLCPPRVFGYVLREKQWAQLHAHGKKSTAKTVALKAEKPLFAISVADVGTEAKHVESNLRRIFTLATTWQAILLIDEADVFLQSRSLGVTHGGNIERNALVSVLLRVLEYYQGILMLTTNQIAQFDVAVHSRIHVAIKYRELKEDRAMAIFRNFLDPLDRKGKVKDMDKIVQWLQREIRLAGFGGRQIRNVVTSALSLARARGDRQLSRDHLSDVVDNVHEFKLEFIRQYENYKTQQQGLS
ncbi:hypothetical protein UA08_03412 [Talaromyces atroroseus]|uniref:Uncharacterized protein n=1 Tax=Talaromyces atroroseus TaxID=1441469 RepID=A0A225AHC0_TALAT|nr:hypothetical protein UA08_03412 [Talaromyces atroroseus]OKL60822.1 hypothetical protein UA08_03412 [Talaromyces atroroseus]